MAEGTSGSSLNNNNADDAFKYIHDFMPRKEIQHCVLSWSIENFQFVSEDGDKYITSSYFTLDLMYTMWNMRFYPHNKVDLLTRMKFCLCRYDEDGGPDLLKVNYRFGLKNEDQNIWFVRRENVTFKRGTEDSILTSEKTYEDNREVLKNNSVTVVCEMYILEEGNESESPIQSPSVDILDLMRLSYHMTLLRKSQSLSDVLLSVNRNIFRLHKCILSARSSHFANYVDRKPVIDLTSTDNNHIYIIINYMYSGNFTYSIYNNAIKFGLYECSEKYGVNGLTQLLAPKCINLRSIIVEKTFLFTWNIENFNDLALRRDERLISPPFSGLSPNSPIWYMDIYPKSTTTHPNFISVLIRCSQAIEAVRIYTTLSLLNENSDVVFHQHSETPLLSKTTFGFLEFIRTDMLAAINEFLDNDKLIIKCAISLFISDNYYEGSSVCLKGKDEEFPCLQRLSADMEMLLKSKTFSDKLLFAEGERFMVHKAILSKGCPNFLTKFNISIKEIGIPDVDPTTLEIIIFYAYTAKLKQYSIQQLMKLIEASLKYNLKTLLCRCYQLMVVSMGSNNVFHILKFSYDVKSEFLINKCYAFVKNHKSQIQSTQKISSLIKERGLFNYIKNQWAGDIK